MVLRSVGSIAGHLDRCLYQSIKHSVFFEGQGVRGEKEISDRTKHRKLFGDTLVASISKK